MKKVIIDERVENPKFKWTLELSNLSPFHTQVTILGERGGLKARFIVDPHELKNKVNELDIMAQ